MKSSISILILIFSLSCFINTQANYKTKKLSEAEDNLDIILLNEGYFSIPLQQASNQNTFLIKGSLDGKESGFFILDTGGIYTEIDSNIAKKYDLKTEENPIIIGGADSQQNHSVKTNLPSLALNNFVSHNETAYVVNENTKRPDRQPIMGLIGNDYLFAHQAIIDCKSKKLYLKPSNEKPSIELKALITQLLLTQGYALSELKKSPTNHLTLEAAINNSNPTDFIFDSGDPFTMISLELAHNLNLKLQKLADIGGSGGGNIEIYQTNIDKLSIGTISWAFLAINVIDFRNIKIGVPVYGAIGLDWMTAHFAIIDLSNNLVFYKRSNEL